MKTKGLKQILLASMLFAGTAIANASSAYGYGYALESLFTVETEVPMPSVENEVLCGPGEIVLHVLDAEEGDGFKWYSEGEILIEGMNEFFLEIPYLGETKKFGVQRVTPLGVSRILWVNVVVEEIPETPGIILLGDTEICDGETIELRSTFEENNLWSNGETTTSIFVSETGNYSVQQVSEFCISAPSEAVGIMVHGIPDQPVVTASGDLEFCEGESLVLSSSFAEGNVWSTGETTQSITVSVSGTYSVYVVENGCESEPSEELIAVMHELPAIPGIELIGENPFCEGSGVRLVSTASENFVWSTGETTRTIIVSEPGTYYLTVFTDYCEVNSDNFLVEEFEIPSPLYITELSGSLQSSYSANNQWYKDNEVIVGASNATFTPIESGDYFVQVIFDNGCAFESETLEINIVEAPDPTLGQNELGKSDIKLYPNPAKDFIQIAGVENASVEMYDITGRMVLNVSNFHSRETLAVDGFGKGVYLLVIEEGKSRLTKRVIVE